MSADTAYRKRWALDRAEGRFRMVDARPAREHIHALQSARLSTRAIADVAGVAPSVISNVDRGKQASLRVATARAILAVTADAVYARQLATGFVPNVGAKRRIGALLALGWRHEDITREMGARCGTTSPVVLHQAGGWVAKVTHDAVVTAYAALSMRPGASDRTRHRALAAGYAPPLAWDDDDLDDPNAEPTEGWRTCAEPGCVEEPHAARGWCWTHYNQRRRAA